MKREEFDEVIRTMWKDLRAKGFNDKEIWEITEKLYKKIWFKKIGL